MRIAAILAAWVLLSASSAGAQQADQQVTPEPVPPPATDGALPEVVVDVPTAPQQQVEPKKQPTSSGASTAQGQGAPSSVTPETSGRGPETAYGPVEGYSATRSATGSKTDTPLKEVPQSISVVGAEQIRDMDAQSIQETLRYVPGVVADPFGPDNRADSALIRGTTAVQYLDGLRRTFGFSTYNYRVDPFFMERVEVLRGPSSVLYGQAPVGGIINAVSKLPQSEEGGEITVEYGNFDYKQVKFDTTGPASADGKWSYRLTGLARDADTQVDYVEDDRYAIQPSLTYRPDADTSITLMGLFQKEHTGSTAQFFHRIGTLYPNVNGRRIPRERFIGEPDDYIDKNAASGSLIIEHAFSPSVKVRHVSRYSNVDTTNDYRYAGHFVTPVPYLDAGQEYTARVHNLGDIDTQVFGQDTNIEVNFATGLLTHRVLGGVDYANFRESSLIGQGLDATPFNVYDPIYGQPETLLAFVPCGGTAIVPVAEIPLCDSKQNVSQTGLYVQDQMRLGNWIAVVGARKDWIENETDTSITPKYTQKDDAVSYRAGLMYEFGFGLTPYVSYGESFVPVTGTTSPARGSTAFAPQTGRMYEVGFKYQPTGANFAINGAIYDIAESNRLESDNANPIYNVQSGAVAIQGFEIEVVGQLTENLKVAGGYSYTDAQYDGEVNTGNQLETVPKHLASLWGVWEFDQPELRGWSVGAGARYIGASWDSSNTIKTPGVTLYDAMVAYEEEHWRWSLNAKNLEDKVYLTTCLNRGDCWFGTARTITTALTYKY
jgi:iron complex outermembrane recepter protein